MIAQSIGFASTSFEPTWTTEQVAEFLGFKRQTIYNLLNPTLGDPTFPKPRKQGRKNAFIPSEIAAYRAQSLGLENKMPGAVTPGETD